MFSIVVTQVSFEKLNMLKRLYMDDSSNIFFASMTVAAIPCESKITIESSDPQVLIKIAEILS
jgi:hypothetical protein